MLCDTNCFLNSLAYKSVVLNKNLEIISINNDWEKYIIENDTKVKK